MPDKEHDAERLLLHPVPEIHETQRRECRETAESQELITPPHKCGLRSAAPALSTKEPLEPDADRRQSARHARTSSADHP
jgi:hypothetical protein